MHQKHLLKIILFLSIFSIPICGNWLFLLNNGELMSIENIVDTQLSNDYCIVGLATRNQGYYYKKEMYHRLKPDILIHGSSRVMQFKGTYFSQNMFNSGGTMSSVNEGYSFLKEAFAEHKPKLVIIGIDYWWFNKSVVEPSSTIKPPLPLSHQISLRSYLLPYQWLWQKKVPFSYYFETMNPFYAFNSKSNQGIGLDGAMNRTGFAPDGSYFYTKTVTGKEVSRDKHFEFNLELVASNDSRFEKDARVDPIHFNNFLSMVDFIKQSKVKVIFFIPPVAPLVENKLKNLALMEDLRHHL